MPIRVVPKKGTREWLGKTPLAAECVATHFTPRDRRSVTWRGPEHLSKSAGMIIPVRCFTCGKVRGPPAAHDPTRAGPRLFLRRAPKGWGWQRAFSLARARRERRGLARHTRAFHSCDPAVSGEARSPGERLGLGRVPSASGRSFARPARTRIRDAAADSDPLPSLRSGDRKQVGHVPGPAPGGLLRARRPGRARSAAVLLQAHAHDARRSHRETPQLQHARTPGLETVGERRRRNANELLISHHVSHDVALPNYLLTLAAAAALFFSRSLARHAARPSSTSPSASTNLLAPASRNHRPAPPPPAGFAGSVFRTD